MKIINMVSGIYKLFLSEFVEVAFFFFFKSQKNVDSTSQCLFLKALARK